MHPKHHNHHSMMAFLDQLLNISIILLSIGAIAAGLYLIDYALMGDNE